MIHKKASARTPHPTNPDDQVMAIRLNDEQSIRNIYVQHYPAAERYILSNKGTYEEAKDIYQEAFIAVWRNIKLEKFTPRHENSLRHYLLQIVKHKWLDHLRSARHRNTVLLNEELDGETDLLPDEQHEQIAIIKQHFGKLGEMCREVLRRFYYKKQSLSIIAEAFRWTEATARNNKYRCIERLRAFVDPK